MIRARYRRDYLRGYARGRKMFEDLDEFPEWVNEGGRGIVDDG